ncbi:MAG TPA: hypothetical protein VLS89_21200 [Candidatus Nanopelagicales bacterium]|nr:hypothetical protein [Candidatus Nanopelagicales bacterium]
MNLRIARAAVMLAFFAAACAPIPRPSVLAEVDQVRRGAAAEDAKQHAPSALAHADKLRREASAAFEADDAAGAQILGERALAAYAHAHALARVARAEEAVGEARKSLDAAQAELTRTEADQARVAAELDALDMKLKVAREAQSIAPSGEADPEREKARLAAARALSLQARTLCAAARLLVGPASAAAPAGSAAAPAGSAAAPAGGAPTLGAQVDEAVAAGDKLDATLATPGAAPIDEASRARARCLSVLTAARRAATPVSRAPGVGDALLSELSGSGGWSPARDDRGVVVTLRGLFGAGATLTPAGEARLKELAKVAAAHPDFPVAVVLHADREPQAREQATWQARAEAVVRALRAGNVQRVETVIAGARAPVVDPAGRERGRNARVEIVFVTPQAL